MSTRIKVSSELGRLLQDKIGVCLPKPQRNKAMAGVLALGRLPQGERNSLEQEYEQHLMQLQAQGRVLWFEFEPMTLKLADRTTYTPDFLVQMADRTLELHEVKGRWMDDARVKIKIAADVFRVFRFVGIKKRPKKEGGGWAFEYFD